ncbi:hypothetical protein ABW19_dt0204906 [Dactylella cylindrospora]|nr:hypothetical protein ABW19_dt0204906 [Dactylella cylindrospora]
MKVFVELMAVPTRDNSSSLILLHFDERRYMLGHISEGTQRILTENVSKFHRISDVFLAGKTEWKNNGGLIGLLLTMGDIKINRQMAIEATKAEKQAKAEKYMILNPDGTMVNPYPSVPETETLTVHGGKNLLNTISTARNFVFRENSGVIFHEYDFTKPSENVFKDEYVTVKPLRAFPRRLGSGQEREIEEIRLQKIEDTNLGSREQLGGIVQSMWNCKPGALTVGKDDEDYVSALVSRLKDDEERAQREQRAKNGTQKQAASDRGEGQSPPKRPKLDSEAANDSEATWDNILDDSAPEQPNDTPIFPKGRPLRRPWPAAMTRSLPGTIPSGSTLSYMVNIADVRGKFLPQKAKELGVSPGPDFRTLAQGGTIVLPDGTVVEGQHCLEPPRKIPGMAFLDIPDEGFLESTIENILAWKEETKANNENDNVGIWVWATGPGMENNRRLLEFIETLEGQHMINSPTAPFNDMSLRGSASQTARLNLLSEENFPIPCPEFDDSVNTGEDTFSSLQDKFIQSRDSLIIDVHPNPAIVTFKARPRFHRESVQEEAKTKLGDGQYWESVQEVQKQIKAEAPSRPVSSSDIGDVEFITLGTGSAFPSRYRNVSATLVTIPKIGRVLLDCGENTILQLRRSFGNSELAQVLMDLRVIYISHLHADHHMGTVSVIKAWYQATVKDDEPTSKLYLIAPIRYLNFLEEYTQIEDIGLRHTKFIPCERLLSPEDRTPGDYGLEVEPRLEDMMNTLHLERLETSFAIHCRSAFTVAFTFKEPSGFKFAYSGDTRPAPGFVKIGKDCTVLVHEATFDDQLHKEAVAKRHCTTSEAIQAGYNMGAKNLLLTHFSQRYPKLPKLRKPSSNGNQDEQPLCDPFMEVPEGKEVDYSGPMDGVTVPGHDNMGPEISKPAGSDSMNIGFGFDMMRVKVKDFWKLERYIPALESLFKEEEKLDPGEGAEGVDESATSSSKKQKQQKQQKQKPKQGKQQQKKPDQDNRKQVNSK